jgi:hypothetical protein
MVWMRKDGLVGFPHVSWTPNYDYGHDHEDLLGMFRFWLPNDHAALRLTLETLALYMNIPIPPYITT